MHTLSFTILNDLEPCYGPIHVPLDNLEFSTIKSSVKGIAKPFLKYAESTKYIDSWGYEKQDDEESDPTGRYFEGYCAGPYYDPDYAAKELVEDGYHVWNRLHKYYVVAFAIDYIRFEVYSKSCDKELVEWREDDRYDEIVENIDDPNYNENPVITMVRQTRNM